MLVKRLLSNAHLEALASLGKFADSNDAYTKRGIAEGIERVIIAVGQITTYDGDTPNDAPDRATADRYDRATGY